MIVDQSYILNCLQQIVNKAHTDPIKKHIKVKHGGDAYNFACPYCLDSDKNARNYRGNLNSILFYRCFNCGTQSHFTSMCKDFGISITTDIKIQIYEYLDKQTTYKNYKSDFSSIKVKNLISLEKLQNDINNFTCKLPLLNLKPIQFQSAQHTYLNMRGITDKLHTNIWQADIIVGDGRKEPVIVNLNRKGDNLLGIQTRNLKDGYYRQFHIFNYQDLYEALYTEDELNVSEGEMVMYNKLSYFYNVLNVDFQYKITLFEGYIDSLYYPNSIGLVGTSTDTSFFEDNDLDIQYFYDNDKAGFDKANDKIETGFSVFLWNKLFNYIVESKKADDPYQLEYRIKKVKDLNKLASLSPEPYSKLQLNKYFSVDKYDKKYLPPKSKKYKPKSNLKYNI